VQANVNNNILTLIGNSSTGAATISVCAYAGSCASLTANVSNATTGGGMSLSQSAISILAGQSSNITIFGGSTPYNISSTNSNSANIFNGNISGNILTVYGVNPGAVTINICSSLGCVPLAITINSTASSTNPPAFSQNNVLLNAGQQATVYVSGTGSFYVANNSNPTAATAQISASTATVYALASGSTNISICQSGGQCSTLYVTVNSSNQSATFSLSLPVQSVAVGSIATFTASAPGSATPSYYLSDSFSGTTISNANINTSGVFNWTPAAGDVGVHSITVYAAFPAPGGSLSATAQITVTQNIVPTPTPAPQITYYNFLRFLGYGDTGDDVLLLQKLLVGKGFLTATPSGHYGPATIAAIKKFQEANGINQTGNVGSLTKAALNKIPMSTSGSTDLTKQQQISAIEQAIQQLLAQLAQIRGQ
jgi:hypothetical protein